MPFKYHVILNASAGTANATGVTPESIVELFGRHGLVATVDADVKSPMDERIRGALDSDADVLVAGGGDGTVGALAEALAGTARILAILPLGTVNAVARDLGMPLTLEEAIADIARGTPQRMDVGEVNGHFFLHMAVVGFVAGIAAARERVRGRFGLLEAVAFGRFFVRRLMRSRRLALAVSPSEGEAHIERAQALAVVCSEFSEGFGRMFARDRFDSGALTVYVVRHLDFTDLLRLTARMFLGRWQQDEALKIERVREVRLDTKKPALKVMLDGELITIETPLVFRIRPLALTVLMPPVEVDPVVQATPEISTGESAA
ncbi:diacylglycerol/lipid kinase family protein [Devosia nitrariae]|uniref:Diacylglycerol kinase n=1 Tax=Devosia nitrariae TaxID=2071872 RepID=A0ABQ5WB36_9HYPH|nr:diacylglycerol kinase family protein [Devosia nitrariae]GLQ57335.1 diacylglycerol kinase [Devosia nitrariae]